MKEWIDLALRLIGFAVVASTVLIIVRIVFNKYVKGPFCKHHYIVQCRLKQNEKNVIFLVCKKCGRKKDVEIYDDKLRIELKGEVEE